MAITKNHPIDTTLKKALDYICNPDKTDETILIYSYGCSPETADIEFEWTKKNAIDKGKHIARHLIQAFEPGETTPEQAHEIGIKFAEACLGGKHEFILSTHIDKGHIHNHIIFNDVNFVDYTHSHVNKKWYYQTRKISDRICEEYNLSVIRNPSGEKGKSYIEHTAAKNGTSYKAKLKSAIDKAITRSNDFEDFLLRMEIAGYEIKRGKYVSFRAEDQERFTRTKTLGAYYTEDSIVNRIEKSKERRAKQKAERRINLLIDIQNSIKAQESKGIYRAPSKPALWEEEEQRSRTKIRHLTDLSKAEFVTTRAKINNLKQASMTLNYLTENGITTYEKLEEKAKEIHSDFDVMTEKIKVIERQINDTAILIKHLNTYTKLKPIYKKYQSSKNKEAFAEKHRSKIILFEAAQKYLKGKNPPPADVLKISFASMTEEKEKLYEQYKILKKKSAEIDTIKSNVETLLGASHKPSLEKSALLD